MSLDASVNTDGNITVRHRDSGRLQVVVPGTFGDQADLAFDHTEDILKWVSDMAIDGTLAKFERVVLVDNIHGQRSVA